MARARVGTVLGTMEFGRGPCVGTVPGEMVQLCLPAPGFKGLDTALMYSGGKSETLLGEMACWKGATEMATKINPWEGKNFGRESVRKQVEGCLSRLQVPSVEIMYLHAPDHKTPLTETLAAMDELHKEGKFTQLGLSNYSAWLVNEVVNVCKTNSWLLPTVYQGMYSGVTRQVEEELLPCLRYHGIAFYAYSPLGGGILSGKYKFEQQEEKSITKGRFNGVGWDKVYRDRYWHTEHFQAMERLKALLAEHHGEDVGVAEAAFRWIYLHSALDGGKGDCVVLGASRMEQIKMNMDLSTKAEPLAEPVVKFFDEWWKSTKHLCPTYFR